MTCSDARAVLSISLVPGGIDARSLLGVEEHIAACEGCRAEKLELLRCLVALEMDRAEGPDLVASIAARLDEQPRRARRWSRPLAAAAVLLAAVGLIRALRSGDGGQAPSTARPRLTTRPGGPERAWAPEDVLLLTNGHELRLDGRIAWVHHDDQADANEDWGDRVIGERGETLRLGTGLAIPQIAPPSREDGVDEQVFPFNLEDER